MYEWAFVNVNMRPFYAEGSKTLAFETAEQLGWQTPDHVVVPVASGSLLTKIQKGFQELHKVGLLDEEPNVRVSGAQALGCSPIATAFIEESDTIRPVKPDTIAKSLAIGNPADGYFALDAVRTSGGGFAAVTDDEIVDGMRLLARTEGIFAETAGGVTIATLKKLAADGVIRPDERVVVYITGHGLKTIEAVAPTCGPDRDDRADPRRVPRRVRHRGALRSTEMAVPFAFHAVAQPLRRRGRGEGRRRDRRGRVEGARSAAPRVRRALVRRARASCAASSTCSSPTRTSASCRASTHPSTTATVVSIVPAVAGG